jgi:hypothetical protein
MSKLVAIRLPDELAEKLAIRCSIRHMGKTELLIEAIARGWDERTPPVEQRPPAPNPLSAKLALLASVPGLKTGAILQAEPIVPIEDDPPEPEEDCTPTCCECDKPLRAKMYRGVAVAWACADLGCPMFGREKK